MHDDRESKTFPPKEDYVRETWAILVVHSIIPLFILMFVHLQEMTSEVTKGISLHFILCH